MKKMKKGFTIVELVIVIGVIAILSAILIPTFTSLSGKANDARAAQECSDAYTAYVLDASDGYYGAEGTGTKIDGATKQIGEVYVLRDSHKYEYSGGKWVVNDGLATGTVLNAVGAYNTLSVYAKA